MHRNGKRITNTTERMCGFFSGGITVCAVLSGTWTGSGKLTEKRPGIDF